MANPRAPQDATLAELATEAVPGIEIAVGETTIVGRVAQWFQEAIEHPLWQKYIKESAEDEGFYIGGDYQWSVDGSYQDLEALRAATPKRTVVTLNHCQSVVDVVLGYERQNRFDIKAEPQGDEDVDDVRLLTLLLRFVQEQTESSDLISELFEDGVIQGMGLYEVAIDWTTDPVNGEVGPGVLKPGRDVIWDPYWKRYDLSDAKYVLKFKWAYQDDLIAEYPEHAAVIRAAGDLVKDTLATGGGWTSASGGPDAYGTTTQHPAEANATPSKYFYDDSDRRLLVIAAWYREYETKWLVFDKDRGTIFLEAESGEEARRVAASNPETLTAVSRKRPKIMTATVIPAAGIELEAPVLTPYENDLTNYPFVPYIARRRWNEIYGIIRNIKDPQRIENKRLSQVMDLLGRFAAIRQWYEEGALVNPHDLRDPTSTAPIAIRAGHQPPGFLVPPLGDVARVLVELGMQMKVNLREIPGINPDLLGLRSDDSSGIAIARRQQQGQVIATSYFSNLKRSRRLIGQRYAKRAQQVFSSERTIRLTDDVGTSIVVTLNPLETKAMGRDDFRAWRQKRAAEPGPKILKDVSALKYDVVISEVPSTPTARLAAFQSLVEIIKLAPEQLGPALLDILIELAPDVPHRDQVIGRIRAIMQGPGQGPAPMNPGPGGAPPAPSALTPPGPLRGGPA